MSAWLLKNSMFWAVQKCSDARRAKTEPRGVYGYTLSGAVCSATQQMSVFQQSSAPFFDKSYWYRTDRCDFAVWGNPQCAVGRDAVTGCTLREETKQSFHFHPVVFFRVNIAKQRRKSQAI